MDDLSIWIKGGLGLGFAYVIDPKQLEISFNQNEIGTQL